MQTGLGLKWRSILERKTGRSLQLPGASFCIRQQQAKANKRLSFCWHTGIRYYMYRKKWGSRHDSIDLGGCEPRSGVLQGAKGLALAQERFQSTRRDEKTNEDKGKRGKDLFAK